MQPKVSSKLFITSTGIAEPPEMQVRRLDTSYDVGVLDVQHAGVHRRDALEDGDLVAADDLEGLLGVEAGDQRQAGAGGAPRR